MRAIIEVLVVDDSDDDAALTLDALRDAAPDATALRLTDSQWPAYRAAGSWAALFDRTGQRWSRQHCRLGPVAGWSQGGRKLG